MTSYLQGRRLRLTVSAIALLSMSVQPALAQGRGGDAALNACGAQREGLVKLEKEYKELKRSKMASAVGEGLKQGAMVVAKGVMSGGIPLGGRGGGGFGGAMGGMGGLMGAVGGLAAQSAAQQQAQAGGAPAPSAAGLMFGQDMLSGAMGLNVPGISGYGGFGGGDNAKAYAALAVLVAIVATADAYAKLKEQEAGGDLKKASFNIDQDAGRQLTVAQQIANDGNALVECRAAQLNDINTRLASAANDKDRKAIRRERTDLIGALKKDIDLTGGVVEQHTGMAKTFTQGRAMTDASSEADVLGGQTPAYATAADTSRLAMPKAGAAPQGQQTASAPPAAPPSSLVALKASAVRSAPVASADVLMNLPAGREIRPKSAQPDGGWWEIDVAGSSGYVRASDVGPPGSVPVQTAAAGKPAGKGAPPRGKGAQAKAPPPPAPAGPTNIRAYNRTVIAARDNGKGRLASLMTDIQTSQKRESVFYAWLERIGLG